MGRPGTRNVDSVEIIKSLHDGSEMVGLRFGRLASDEKSPEPGGIHLFPILMPE